MNENKQADYFDIERGFSRFQDDSDAAYAENGVLSKVSEGMLYLQEIMKCVKKAVDTIRIYNAEMNTCNSSVSYSYSKIIDDLRKQIGMKKSRTNITNSVRRKYTGYLDAGAEKDYVLSVPDEAIEGRYILWLIEKYFINEDFKREQLTPLCLGLNSMTDEDRKLLSGNRYRKKYYDAFFKKYLKIFFGFDIEEISVDDGIDYCDQLFGVRGVLRNYKGIIDLRASSWGNTPEAKIECLKLIFYLKCFEIANDDYKLYKILKDREITSVRSDTPEDGNGVIIAKVCHDLSLALDPFFLEACNIGLNRIYTAAWSIDRFCNVIMSCKEERYISSVKVLKKRIEDIIDSAREENAEIKKYSVIQSFYMYIRLFEATVKLGYNNTGYKVDMTPFLDFEMSGDAAFSLNEYGLVITLSDDAYKNMDLKPWIETTAKKHKSPSRKKRKNYRPRLSESFDDIGLITAEDHVFESALPIGDIIIRSFPHREELNAFYKSHKQEIYRFVSPNGEVPLKTFGNNKKHVFFLIYAVSGSNTDALTVYLCYYLYFRLGNLTLNSRYYKADFSNPMTVKNNIMRRNLSLLEQAVLRNIIFSMKGKLRVEAEQEPDQTQTELVSMIREHLFALFDMNDVFSSAYRIMDYSRKLSAVEEEFCRENGIII